MNKEPVDELKVITNAQLIRETRVTIQDPDVTRN
jgi:hypothetical protein